MDAIEYPFPSDSSKTDYCVFPASLEDDDLVLFHATRAENLDAIIKDGFKIPDPSGQHGLSSVSFAKRSVSALTHGMQKRGCHSGKYVIIAVRYKSLNRNGLQVNSGDIHDYTLEPPPEIIGICRVPETYLHV